jgi:hypothetical protein
MTDMGRFNFKMLNDMEVKEQYLPKFQTCLLLWKTGSVE